MSQITQVEVTAGKSSAAATVQAPYRRFSGGGYAYGMSTTTGAMKTA